jgi:hypothetical protein
MSCYGWQYDLQKRTQLEALFDAQARRSDLIFGSGISTANTRFLHVDRSGNQTRFDTDDDNTATLATLATLAAASSAAPAARSCSL